MLIACVQSDVTFADPQDNVRRVLQWMKKASGIESQKDSSTSSPTTLNADLVVFPECMLSGYTFESRESAREAAISADSNWIKVIAEAADKYGQLVVVGFLESSQDQLYNASALIGPQGLLALYRKIHLPHLGVDRFVDRGNVAYQAHAVPSSSGQTVKVGLAICYDGSFPEPMRVLALDGADVIALSTNWPVEAPLTPDIVPRARSMENHLFFVAANRVGTENGVGFSGRSSICGPDGVVLAQSPDAEETILFASVDLEQARNKQIQRTPGSHVIDRFQDRRPEFYGRLSD